MMMVDTDGYENASKEHTQESIKAMVEQRKEAGWAFMLMSQSLDRVATESLAAQGSAVGMATQPAVYTSRASNYARASAHTVAYFVDGAQPTDGEVLGGERRARAGGSGTRCVQERTVLAGLLALILMAALPDAGCVGHGRCAVVGRLLSIAPILKTTGFHLE